MKNIPELINEYNSFFAYSRTTSEANDGKSFFYLFGDGGEHAKAVAKLLAFHGYGTVSTPVSRNRSVLFLTGQPVREGDATDLADSTFVWTIPQRPLTALSVAEWINNNWSVPEVGLFIHDQTCWSHLKKLVDTEHVSLECVALPNTANWFAVAVDPKKKLMESLRVLHRF